MRVCLVCSGNICRSPSAEVVLRRQLAGAGLSDLVVVSSSGTGDWHVGEPMDPRAAGALARRGYPTGHRAREFDPIEAGCAGLTEYLRHLLASGSAAAG